MVCPDCKLFIAFCSWAMVDTLTVLPPLIVTVVVYVLDPPSLSLIRALTALFPAVAYWVTAEAVVESVTSQVPLLSKSKLYLNPAVVSAVDTSAWLAKLIVTFVLVLTGPLLVTVAVGATLLTVTAAESVAVKLLASVTVSVT